jgi:hypothetical protein
MSRAEPCPVPGCIDFKGRDLIMCRHHWRMLHFVTRRIINGLWHRLIKSKHCGDDAGFRANARNFLDVRKGAISQICEKENINVVCD